MVISLEITSCLPDLKLFIPSRRNYQRVACVCVGVKLREAVQKSHDLGPDSEGNRGALA
jgi:hypothetical protein